MPICYYLLVATWTNIVEEGVVTKAEDHVDLQANSHDEEGHYEVHEQVPGIQICLLKFKIWQVKALFLDCGHGWSPFRLWLILFTLISLPLGTLNFKLINRCLH